jgi:hypothetical protein
MPDRIPRDELTDLEHRLAALRPATSGLDRDRTLFEAGRASARAEGRARAWGFVAAASMLVAVGLGVGLARERARALDLERALVAAREAPAPSAAPAPAPLPPIEIAPNSYLALSHRALAGLDEPPAAPGRHPVDIGPTAPERPLSPLRVRGAGDFRDL